MTPHPLRHKVLAVLKEVEPVLGMHGGSIELVNITPDNIVELRFLGACVGCTAADITLEFGLKEMLMIQIEEINDVRAVNTESPTHLPPSPSPLHA